MALKCVTTVLLLLAAFVLATVEAAFTSAIGRPAEIRAARSPLAPATAADAAAVVPHFPVAKPGGPGR